MTVEENKRSWKENMPISQLCNDGSSRDASSLMRLNTFGILSCVSQENETNESPSLLLRGKLYTEKEITEKNNCVVIFYNASLINLKFILRYKTLED